MAKRQKPPADELTTRILKSNHAHRPHECFQWLVARQLERFGVIAAEVPKQITAEVDGLCQIYDEAVHDDPWNDILGNVYMSIASNGCGEVFGQYFTPFPIAQLMARSLLGEPPGNQNTTDTLIKVLEPACGSGVMLLAFAQCVIDNFGRTALRAYSFTAVDLDCTVARIAAAQLLTCLSVTESTLGELVVLHGNSLVCDQDMRLIVHATCRDLTPTRIAPALHPQRLEAIRASAASANGQMDLFDMSIPLTGNYCTSTLQTSEQHAHVEITPVADGS